MRTFIVLPNYGEKPTGVDEAIRREISEKGNLLRVLGSGLDDGQIRAHTAQRIADTLGPGTLNLVLTRLRAMLL